MEKMILDGKNGVLHLQGTCTELRDTCQALCCRRWNVPLTQAEYESNKFTAEKTCRTDSQACLGTYAQCPQRLFRLKMKKDKSCFYLTEESFCSIYETRPAVCRAFSCAGGWNLTHVQNLNQEKQAKLPEEFKQTAAEFSDEMIFQRNPDFNLKTIFINQEKQEAVFVIKPFNKCGTSNWTASLTCPGITEQLLEAVLRAFNGTDTLGVAFVKSLRTACAPGSKEDFTAIVNILRSINLLVLKR
jgi:Fe-S-cluster containining protein